MLGSAALSDKEHTWWISPVQDYLWNQWSYSEKALVSSSSSFPGGRGDVLFLALYRQVTNFSWYPAEIYRARVAHTICMSSDGCRLCMCTIKFRTTMISSTFQFRQCSEQVTCIKLPLHSGPIALILLWHIIKPEDEPQEVSYASMFAALVLLWIQAWKVTLIFQSHCHWKRVQEMLLGARLCEPSYLWSPSDDLNIFGPDPGFPWFPEQCALGDPAW